MPEQRAAPRRVYMCRTQILYGPEQTVSGMIEDRSVSGLGIRVPRPLPLGMPIRVCFRDEMHAAVVRRCVKDQPGFFIGVAFSTGDPAQRV
jgi:hypothetical protein